MAGMTQIRITVETRESIKSIGNMGDTYDDVIMNLITMYKFAHPDKSKEKTAEEQDQEWIDALGKADNK